MDENTTNIEGTENAVVDNTTTENEVTSNESEENVVTETIENEGSNSVVNTYVAEVNDVEKATFSETKNIKDKIKGFGSCKFILSLMMILFTAIAGATLMIDMFIMHYEQSIINEASFYDYIKGTDIFNMINYFGDYSSDEKTFVITAIVCMIVTIGIGIVQIFLIMLWRNKRGYVVVMFTSVMAIVSEGIMICVFLEKYVNSQYDAIGMVGYGPVIAIASHVFVIMLAGVTRKLTKINSVVNP